MSVAIIGTVAYDSVKTPHGYRDKILGGSATYAGYAASLFGPVSLVSIVGEDFSDTEFSVFHARDIDIQGVEIAEGKTFHWKGYYEGDMSQAVTEATDLNVLSQFDPKIPDHVRDSSIVFLANTHPVLQRKALAQFSGPRMVMMDSMNYWIASEKAELKKTLRLVDILIVNDQELRLLTGIDNVVEAMPKVLEMGPSRVVVKKGEHGSLMASDQGVFICPAFPLSSLIDPTGAGDSFAGGFAGILNQSDTLDELAFRRAVVSGTLISSFTVQDFSLGALQNLNGDRLDQTLQEFRAMLQLPDQLF